MTDLDLHPLAAHTERLTTRIWRTDADSKRVSRLRSCAAVLRDDTILMIEQLSAAGLVVWTLPGGGVEPGESVADAAIRELAEETGLNGVIRRQLVHAPDAIFLVDVDDAAEPVVGDDEDLFALAWRQLADVQDDRQVRLVLAAL